MTKKQIIIVMVGLLALDIIAWSDIAGGSFGKRLELFFFDVGQGDSEMIAMPGGVKVLIDGGPHNGRAATSLEKVLLWRDRYIDVVMVSHLELDHFGGLLDVLKRYRVGVFVYNGRAAESESAKELLGMLKRSGTRIIVVGEGDAVTYGENRIDVISGQHESSSKTNANESALVVRFVGGGVTALFAGDVGAKTERRLIYERNVQADILKVAHHGSKYSSTREFLEAVHPRVAIIEVGKNAYGHPTSEVLKGIEAMGANLFRTDRDGMVKLVPAEGRLQVFSERQAF